MAVNQFGEFVGIKQKNWPEMRQFFILHLSFSLSSAILLKGYVYMEKRYHILFFIEVQARFLSLE
jgi:hypothetical protein